MADLKMLVRGFDTELDQEFEALESDIYAKAYKELGYANVQRDQRLRKQASTLRHTLENCGVTPFTSDSVERYQRLSGGQSLGIAIEYFETRAERKARERAERLADPFLIVWVDSGDPLYVEVWDEPKYNQERKA